MVKKRSAAIEACKRRSNRVRWLDHVELVNEDIEWLSRTERLTLWNVKVPAGLLARIDTLWWLDIRGGSGVDLAAAHGASKLKYLAVNQVRGMCDLSIMSEMVTLRYLDLYGLPKLTELPSCAQLVNLEHARIGQLRGLASLHGLLQAPKLRELEFVRKITLSEDDVNGIVNHPAIGAFSWFAEDVPVKIWAPVIEKIALPAIPVRSAKEWFGLSQF
jgi:hypothetical protein